LKTKQEAILEQKLTARSASLRILNNFDERHILDYGLANELDGRDRARVREHLQGLFRKRSYVDFLIGSFSHVPVIEMNGQILNVLRLGIYEMLFMDGTPDYAAINETVELAKVEISAKTADLVNAVMRSLQREMPNLPKPSMENRTELIATTFSHPDWMVERWVSRFGEKEAFLLMQANNAKPNHFIRVNNLKTRSENFEIRMEKAGVEFEASDWLPGYYKIDDLSTVLEKGWFEKGFCFVQDIAAAFAPTILDPQEDEIVYDLCSAPGMKAILMANMMNGTGSITAVDINAKRLERLAENALTFNAENIKIMRGDATDLSLKMADAVLLDAPCTGTGVLAKRADLRWKRTKEELDNIVKLQEDLLDEAANLVKKGGRLVYSTCSIEPEENMGQIEKFLAKYDNFELQALDEFLDEEVLSEDLFSYQTLPHIHQCDGHFGVLLKRVK